MSVKATKLDHMHIPRIIACATSSTSFRLMLRLRNHIAYFASYGTKLNVSTRHHEFLQGTLEAACIKDCAMKALKPNVVVWKHTVTVQKARGARFGRMNSPSSTRTEALSRRARYSRSLRILCSSRRALDQSPVPWHDWNPLL
jgi:hypothetical protein